MGNERESRFALYSKYFFLALVVIVVFFSQSLILLMRVAAEDRGVEDRWSVFSMLLENTIAFVAFFILIGFFLLCCKKAEARFGLLNKGLIFLILGSLALHASNLFLIFKAYSHILKINLGSLGNIAMQFFSVISLVLLSLAALYITHSVSKNFNSTFVYKFYFFIRYIFFVILFLAGNVLITHLYPDRFTEVFLFFFLTVIPLLVSSLGVLMAHSIGLVAPDSGFNKTERG